jgi:hypothetical protein
MGHINRQGCLPSVPAAVRLLQAESGGSQELPSWRSDRSNDEPRGDYFWPQDGVINPTKC